MSGGRESPVKGPGPTEGVQGVLVAEIPGRTRRSRDESARENEVPPPARRVIALLESVRATCRTRTSLTRESLESVVWLNLEPGERAVNHNGTKADRALAEVASHPNPD